MAWERRVPGRQMTREQAAAVPWSCGAGAESGTGAGAGRARAWVLQEAGGRGGGERRGAEGEPAIGSCGGQTQPGGRPSERWGLAVAWGQSRGWTGGGVGGRVPCRGAPCRRLPRCRQYLPSPKLAQG